MATPNLLMPWDAPTWLQIIAASLDAVPTKVPAKNVMAAFDFPTPMAMSTFVDATISRYPHLAFNLCGDQNHPGRVVVLGGAQ